MPHPAGVGRWHQALLVALDGVPREAGELVREILGREPTTSEYSAAHRAARTLGTRGLVELSHLKNKNIRRLVLAKVPGAESVTVRKVRDGDAATGAGQVTLAGPAELAANTDAAAAPEARTWCSEAERLERGVLEAAPPLGASAACPWRSRRPPGRPEVGPPPRTRIATPWGHLAVMCAVPGCRSVWYRPLARSGDVKPSINNRLIPDP